MMQKMVLGNATAEQNDAFNVGSAARKLSRGMMECRRFGRSARPRRATRRLGRGRDAR